MLRGRVGLVFLNVCVFKEADAELGRHAVVGEIIGDDVGVMDKETRLGLRT